MNIGLVGLGKWATKIIASIPNTHRLSAVLTQRTDAKDFLANDVVITKTYKDFFSYKFDCIIIANEASKHQSTLFEVRSRMPNLPVFIEKPFAKNLDEIHRYQAFFSSDKSTFVNHTLLFNKNLELIKHKIASGLSLPKKIYCADCNLGPYRNDCNSFWDYGSHPISIILYLCEQDKLEDLNVRVIEATRSQTSYGELTFFKLSINNITEVICTVGNGFPVKVRKYCIETEKELLEFDGAEEVEPKPLAAALEYFFKFENTKDRSGIGLATKVVEILSSIENFITIKS